MRTKLRKPREVTNPDHSETTSFTRDELKDFITVSYGGIKPEVIVKLQSLLDRNPDTKELN